MSYQIRYTDASMVKQVKTHHKRRTKLAIALCVIMLLVSLLKVDSVQDFWIPGETDVTKMAFSSFTQELREGKKLSEAIAVFCRRVIESDILE